MQSVGVGGLVVDWCVCGGVCMYIYVRETEREVILT
jgi:hypothetical protein